MATVAWIATADQEKFDSFNVHPSTGLLLAAKVLHHRTSALSKKELLDSLSFIVFSYADEFFPINDSLFATAKRFGQQLESGLRALDGAVSGGLLDVSGWSAAPPKSEEDEPTYARRASREVADLGTQVERALCLDAGALDVIGAGRDRVWPDLLGAKAKKPPRELSMAASLLNPLPTFSRASIDEVLDIRSELSVPLKAFRGELRSLARDMPQDDNDVDAFLRGVWVDRIQPALDEIDELSEENSYLKQLSDKAMDPTTMLPAVATFALGIAGLSGLAEMITAATSAAAVPLNAVRARRKEQRAIEHKRFYFLWKVQQT